jgi:hypothetical protein
MNPAPLRATLLGALVMIVALTTSCGARPNYDDPAAYRRLLTFDGRLNSKDGAVHAEVGSINDVGDGTFNSHAFLQTMIKVTAPAGERRFRLPWSSDSCQILDLDGDGWSEFVLREWGIVRIVSFRDHAFVFRLGKDEIVRSDEIRLEDVDGDGLLEFVLTFGEDARPNDIRRVTRWTFNTGFSEPK